MLAAKPTTVRFGGARPAADADLPPPRRLRCSHLIALLSRSSTKLNRPPAPSRAAPRSRSAPRPSRAAPSSPASRRVREEEEDVGRALPPLLRPPRENPALAEPSRRRESARQGRRSQMHRVQGSGAWATGLERPRVSAISPRLGVLDPLSIFGRGGERHRRRRCRLGPATRGLWDRVIRRARASSHKRSFAHTCDSFPPQNEQPPTTNKNSRRRRRLRARARGRRRRAALAGVDRRAGLGRRQLAQVAHARVDVSGRRAQSRRDLGSAPGVSRRPCSRRTPTQTPPQNQIQPTNQQGGLHARGHQEAGHLAQAPRQAPGQGARERRRRRRQVVSVLPGPSRHGNGAQKHEPRLLFSFLFFV